MEVPSSTTTQAPPPPISIVLDSCFTQLWVEKRFPAMLETISVGPSSIRPKDFFRFLGGGQWKGLRLYQQKSEGSEDTGHEAVV